MLLVRNPDLPGPRFTRSLSSVYAVTTRQPLPIGTQDDITEYISKSTIIPFLFDKAREKCTIAFDTGSLSTSSSRAGDSLSPILFDSSGCRSAAL